MTDFFCLILVRLNPLLKDAVGSMSPKDLMIRAFQKLPSLEQAKIGFTELMDQESTGQLDDETLLRRLTLLWESRQELLKETMDSMGDTAKTLTALIQHLEASIDHDSVLNALVRNAQSRPRTIIIWQ